MRQRYVVQVIDDQNQTSADRESITSPPAQPDLPVAEIDDNQAPSRQNDVGKSRQLKSHGLITDVVPEAETNKEKYLQANQEHKQSLDSNEPTSIESTLQQTTTPNKQPPMQPEPEDFWEKRQQQIKQLWRQEGLKKAAAEEVRVQHPKTKIEGEGVVNKQENQLLKRISVGSDVQKIENFFQRRNFAGQDSETTPNDRSKWGRWWQFVLSAWQKHRLVGSIILSMAVVIVSGWFAWMAVKNEIESTTSQAEYLVQDLKNNRLTSASERLVILEIKQQQYEKWYQRVRPVVRLAQGQEKTEHLDRLFTVSEQGLEIVGSGLNLYSNLDTAYQQFVGEQEGESVQTFTSVSGDLEALFVQLSALQAELNALGNPYHIELITELQKELGQELPDLRRHVLAAQKISQVLPDILGVEQPKKYLVLLQNNAELRPTGGFVGSFALITVEDGRLLEFSVEDVYEADGQLDGFVTPPEEIVQYLGEEQWFLRDVNWSPDFPDVAERASWFLDKSMQVQVDGVVGINLGVVKRLLAVTGPLELPDYNEVVTADSLYEQAELHSELNFFPGTNNKKDYLSAVSSRLMDELFYQPTNKIELARVILDSTEQSELLISVDNPQVEAVLADLGWNGDVRTPSCPSQLLVSDVPEVPLLNGGPVDNELRSNQNINCIVDTVMQVEANVGVNKTNQYVSREIKHEVELVADRSRHTRTMTWQNSAQSQAWPAGDYKNYLRLYVSEGSELRSAFLNGQPLDLSLFKVSADAGKTVFGYYLEVPIKSKATLEIFYETPYKLTPTDATAVANGEAKPNRLVEDGVEAYALFEQKQPGTSGDEVEHVIKAREYDVVAVAPEPDFIDGEIRFTSDRSQHQFIGVQLD